MRGRKRKKRANAPGFGPFLRRMRKFKFPKVTIQEFADTQGITGPYLSHLELGTVPPPSVELIKSLAEKLDIDVGILMSLAGIGHYTFPPDLSPDIYLSIDQEQPTFSSLNISISPTLITKYFSEVLSGVSELLTDGKVPHEIVTKMTSPQEILNLALYSPFTSLKDARIEAYNKVIAADYDYNSTGYQKDNDNEDNTTPERSTH